MNKSYKFPQPNNYVVNPAYHWQLGFVADGKYCIVRIAAPYFDWV